MSDQKTEQKPDHEKRIREALCLADQDEELITVVASRDLRALLADLQSQQSTQGDTPAAEVSDAELRKTIDALRDPGTVSAFYNGYYTLTPDELRRAILALRPQAVPMTGGWQEVAACPDGDVWFSLSCGHVVMGWKQGPLLLDWEAAVDHDCCSDASAIKAMPVTPPAHHGITAPAGGEVK